MQGTSNWDIKKLGMVLGSIVFLFVVWTYVSSPLVITITGVGDVSVPATNATVSFTLSASENSISGAVTSVLGKADSMRQFLITKGVAESDIAQSQVTAVPSGLVTAGATGFQARVTMAAKTVHVSEVSGLVTDLYNNGALVVSQPILSVENQNALDQEAIDKALKDANSQAFTMGLKNWKLLKKIIAINQISSPATSTSTTKPDTTVASSQTDVAAQNGVFKIVKSVSVSYKMW